MPVWPLTSFLGSFGSPESLWLISPSARFSPKKAPPLLLGLVLEVCLLYTPESKALPSLFHGGVTPFFPLLVEGETEFTRGCGLHAETAPLFKNTSLLVLRASRSHIFLLWFCGKGPHQGFTFSLKAGGLYTATLSYGNGCLSHALSQSLPKMLSLPAGCFGTQKPVCGAWDFLFL